MTFQAWFNQISRSGKLMSNKKLIIRSGGGSLCGSSWAVVVVITVEPKVHVSSCSSWAGHGESQQTELFGVLSTRKSHMNISFFF